MRTLVDIALHRSVAQSLDIGGRGLNQALRCTSLALASTDFLVRTNKYKFYKYITSNAPINSTMLRTNTNIKS